MRKTVDDLKKDATIAALSGDIVTEIESTILAEILKGINTLKGREYED